MEVMEIVPIKSGERIVKVHLSELECRMLLTFAINELINRGSISLLSPDEREQLKRLEGLLEADVKGTA